MEAKKWWQSKTILGAVISVVSGVAGLSIDQQTGEEVAGLLIELGAVVGGLLSIYGRVKASGRIQL